MKKFLAVVLVLASVLFAACGSSISDETRSAASDHIGKISLSLSNASFSLRDAKDALAANSAYSNFAKSIADLTATEATLAKNEGYALVAQDKVLREKITNSPNYCPVYQRYLAITRTRQRRLDAGKRMLGVFTNARFASIEWIRACDDASAKISDLTVDGGKSQRPSGSQMARMALSLLPTLPSQSPPSVARCSKNAILLRKVPTDQFREAGCRAESRNGQTGQ